MGRNVLCQPKSQEALVPYAFHVGIQAKLNPPFPLEGRPSTFKGVQSISPKQYQNYWTQWKPLWASLDNFSTLFSQADAGKDTISVQYLSARIANLDLLYHKSFDATPPEFEALESFRSLASLMAHLKELAWLLKQQGRADIDYRAYATDLEEEQLAYQRHFSQIRQDLASIERLRDVQDLLTTGFRKNDK